MNFPDDENGAVLRRMAAKGIDLTSARMVDFEHVFADETTARNFTAMVANNVPKVTAHQPESNDDNIWSVRCRKRMTPSHREITETEMALADLAQQFGGYSDGWGFLSSPDGSPAEQ